MRNTGYKHEMITKNDISDVLKAKRQAPEREENSEFYFSASQLKNIRRGKYGIVFKRKFLTSSKFTKEKKNLNADFVTKIGSLNFGEIFFFFFIKLKNDEKKLGDAQIKHIFLSAQEKIAYVGVRLLWENPSQEL
ncbi:hypothetical protein C922_00518 [Plasmodium inui San Antonio 1]|uniref:Uncharacterized protein n=1 Tax=Plasmodium inui San Antonio 1 TaxID=1237626 RepID=W7AAS2_9APIC|nr:hypothetical protein C922_00518 [Plasmodium inui San Antonio 1]EUD68830.1 hypothetical protein C922_00518 [Plasmodium inui San Antonio 1]